MVCKNSQSFTALLRKVESCCGRAEMVVGCESRRTTCYAGRGETNACTPGHNETYRVCIALPACPKLHSVSSGQQHQNTAGSTARETFKTKRNYYGTSVSIPSILGKGAQLGREIDGLNGQMNFNGAKYEGVGSKGHSASAMSKFDKTLLISLACLP